MFFFFVCGEHTFRSDVKGYEGLTVQCFNCGNMTAHVVKERPFFTICYVPVIPHTLSGYDDVVCNTCNFHQPLESRNDVLAMGNGGQGAQNQGQGQQNQEQNQEQNQGQTQGQNQGQWPAQPSQGGWQGPPQGQQGQQGQQSYQMQPQQQQQQQGYYEPPK